jgi:hypothetical protein
MGTENVSPGVNLPWCETHNSAPFQLSVDFLQQDTEKSDENVYAKGVKLSY